MGYLVKASFNAEPQTYSLERIKSDVAAKLLPLSAYVHHEKQRFWYSVGELIGEEPTPSFRYPCKHCKDWIVARKIDVGLQIPCEKCGQMSHVPSPEARQREGKFMMVGGGLTAAIGITCTVLNLVMGARTGGMSYITFIGVSIMGLTTFYQGRRRSSQLHHTTPQDKK